MSFPEYESMRDIDEFNDLFGNRHPFYYGSEKNSSESSSIYSDANENESSE